MSAIGDDGIVLFGPHSGAGSARRRAYAGRYGGMHLAIVPVPCRGQWTAECGKTMPAGDAAVSVLHGASIVDDGATRTCWLPPGVHMEEVCYKCMRRAGATHVMGMWLAAPPPKVAQAAPLRVRRVHPRAASVRRGDRRIHGGVV